MLVLKRLVQLGEGRVIATAFDVAVDNTQAR